MLPVLYYGSMTAEEVRPFVRHMVEVYMVRGEPPYRGVFLCGDGETFAVNATSSADTTFQHAPASVCALLRLAESRD